MGACFTSDYTNFFSGLLGKDYINQNHVKNKIKWWRQHTDICVYVSMG